MSAGSSASHPGLAVRAHLQPAASADQTRPVLMGSPIFVAARSWRSAGEPHTDRAAGAIARRCALDTLGSWNTTTFSSRERMRDAASSVKRHTGQPRIRLQRNVERLTQSHLFPAEAITLTTDAQTPNEPHSSSFVFSSREGGFDCSGRWRQHHTRTLSPYSVIKSSPPSATQNTHP